MVNVNISSQYRLFFWYDFSKYTVNYLRLLCYMTLCKANACDQTT